MKMEMRFKGHFYIHGYDIRGRLLEGVYFTVDIDNDGRGFTVEIEDDILADLNAEKIFKDIASYVERSDELLESENPGDILSLIAIGKPTKEITPVIGKALTISEVLSYVRPKI